MPKKWTKNVKVERRRHSKIVHCVSAQVNKNSETERLKPPSDRFLISGGRRLYSCTIPKSRRRLPDSVLARGRARSASCRVDRERIEELTRSWEESVSGSPVQRILCRKFKEWSSYSWRAVGQPSSSRTSDMWSNFLRSDTTRSAKFWIFWRRCMFLSDPFP